MLMSCLITTLYSEVELRLLRRRAKNAQHARTYRQRAKLSQEKQQMLKEKAKERQRRYMARVKERQAYYVQSVRLPLFRVGRVGRSYKAYSQEDIQQAIELIHSGASLIEAETATRVPDATIRRFLKKCAAHDGPCKGAKFRPDFYPQE
ncbi:hypothetical protein ACOMHN_063037 [Nucella lapillus]